MNIFITIVEIIVTFSFLVIACKALKKEGLIMWVAIAPIIANIEVTKCIAFSKNISTTVGNVMFASVFLAIDMINELYDKKTAKKAVIIAIFSSIVYLISMQICISYIPADFDIVQDSMKQLFSINIRTSFASITCFGLANILDIYIYNKIKEKTHNKYMWLRNNISTIIGNCSENILFMIIAFTGVMSMNDIVIMIITTSIVETIIALLDTPFLYIAKYINNKSLYRLINKEADVNERNTETPAGI